MKYNVYQRYRLSTDLCILYPLFICYTVYTISFLNIYTLYITSIILLTPYNIYIYSLYDINFLYISK